MGNRAVITTPEKKFGIYVHWNGGVESILAFAEVARSRGYRDPAGDASYGMARLCGVLCEFFGPGGTGVGIGAIDELGTDNQDNGTYVLGTDWRIIERYGSGSEPTSKLEQLGAEGRAKYDRMVKQLSAATQVPV